MSLDLPDKLEDAFKQFEKLQTDLEKALTEAEVYQHNGLSAYDAVVRAQALSQKLNQMRPLLIEKIEKARESL